MKGLDNHQVFVGWPSDTRKLGMKYCSNRPCALYAVRAPSFGSETRENTTDDLSMMNPSQDISELELLRVVNYGKEVVIEDGILCEGRGIYGEVGVEFCGGEEDKRELFEIGEVGLVLFGGGEGGEGKRP
ncbi:hypothetical protein Tco_0169704 [Tanacetum coccineum]